MVLYTLEVFGEQCGDYCTDPEVLRDRAAAALSNYPGADAKIFMHTVEILFKEEFEDLTEVS